MRRFLFVFALVLALLAGTAAPGSAGPVAAESMRIVVRSDTMRAGVERSASIWAAGQTRYRVQLNSTCYAGDLCVVIDVTSYAGDWLQIDGINVGSEMWMDSKGRCQVRIPRVLTSPRVLASFQAKLDAAGQSTLGVPIAEFVPAGYAGREIGNCAGLTEKPGDGIMSPFPNDHLSAGEALEVWSAR